MLDIPHSTEAEAAVIGGLLHDNSKWSVVEGSLNTDDFCEPTHRAIYSAIRQIAAQGQPFDIVTLPNQLKQMGQLGAAGGEAAIYNIANGTPSSANIHVYADVVKQKSVHRAALNIANAMVKHLSSDNSNIGEYLAENIRELNFLVAQGKRHHGYNPMPMDKFLTMDIAERKLILSPWLPEQGLAMIYAPRGVGKTFLALNIAYAIASGTDFLGWKALDKRKVMYIDGEMPAKTMQKRLHAIESSKGTCVTDMLNILTPDLQKICMPDLGTFEGQVLLDRLLQDVEVVIIDNISTLCRNGKENEAEGWVIVQEWALRMRTEGKSVVFIHHAGKDGGQRGTSKREDILDTCMCLKRAAGYQPTEGASFEVHFMKSRGFFGDEAEPIMATLTTMPDSTHRWDVRPLAASTFDKVVELTNEGLTPKDIAIELEINKSTVSRHIKKARNEGKINGKG